MTNDLTTLQGALYECKDRLISELANKGVTASYSSTTGLLGLIHKISDIQPSLLLTTDINITFPLNIIIDTTTSITCDLNATFDDETVTNIDLIGKLTNATIVVKEGETTIGSGVTNSSGQAIFDINAFSTLGTHNIKAIFDGTDNFPSCESSYAVIVKNAPQELYLDTVNVGNIDSNYTHNTTYAVYRASDDTYIINKGYDITLKNTLSTTYNTVNIEIQAKTSSTSAINKLKVETLDTSNTVIDTKIITLTTTQTTFTNYMNVNGQNFKFRITPGLDDDYSTDTASNYGILKRITVTEYS